MIPIFVSGVGFGISSHLSFKGEHTRLRVPIVANKSFRALPELRRVVAPAPGVVGRPAQLLLGVVGRRVGDPGAAVPARLLPAAAASILLLDHRVVLL